MAAGEVEQAALSYLARGWAVVPIQPGGKRPLVRWEEFQQRLPAVDEVRAWYRKWPDAGVGIVTGAVSRLLVLDIDPRHGGEDSLAEIERRRGTLPPTVAAWTGGGGRHLYFALSGQRLRSKVALAPGLDLRADGGLVVAPPSRHASGRPYRWLPQRDPRSVALAPLPGWLGELLRRQARRPGHPPEHWRTLVRAGVAEGERNATIASLTGHLLWHEVDPEVALELMLCWNRVRCRPPLSDEEVARTVDSILRAHRRDEAEAGGS